MKLKKKMLGIWLKLLITFHAYDMGFLSETPGDLQNQFMKISYCWYFMCMTGIVDISSEWLQN